MESAAIPVVVPEHDRQPPYSLEAEVSVLGGNPLGITLEAVSSCGGAHKGLEGVLLGTGSEQLASPLPQE